MITHKRRRLAAKVGVLAGLSVGALFAGLPVVWMLSTSFKTNGEVFQIPPQLITKNFSFDAYRKILGDGTQMRRCSWRSSPAMGSAGSSFR
jgi:multiple sugar transport system permease protein